MARPYPENSGRCTQLLKEYCEAVFRQLPKALSGEEEPLHLMRVAGRRLRIALPLLSRKPEGRRVKRALAVLRQLTRAAGSSRDLDVGVVLFETRLREVERSAEQAALRRRLRSARNRSRERMAQALLDIEIARVRRDLRAIVARAGADLFTALQRSRRHRQSESATVIGPLEGLGGRFDPEVLHRVRISARRLRYGAEIADALKGVRSPLPKLLKDVQGQLGEIHDAHVLAEWFSVQADKAAASGPSGLEAGSRAEEAHFRELSRSRFKAFLKSDAVATLKRELAGPGRGLSGSVAPLRLQTTAHADGAL